MTADTARVWRVGELSRATGLTVRTLHHYDGIGLLVPSRRTTGGHRLYTDEDVARLALVVVLKRGGLPLAQIAEVLDGGGVDATAMIDRQAAELEAALADTIAFGRRLRAAPIDTLADEPARIRDLVTWAPTHRITAQPIVFLVYADVGRAHRRLVEMFGFGAGEVSRDEHGVAGYAEVTGPTGTIRLHRPRPGLAPPDPAAEPSAMTVVGVADVEAHYAQAVAQGAVIERKLHSMFGMREYLAFDDERHLWCFQQPQ